MFSFQRIGIHPQQVGGRQTLIMNREAKDFNSARIRKQNEVAMRERLLKARKSGELPKGINVDNYTRYLSSILAGLSIQAANGSTKEELKRTAQMEESATLFCYFPAQRLEFTTFQQVQGCRGWSQCHSAVAASGKRCNGQCRAPGF
jgi:hypothetical protein